MADVPHVTKNLRAALCSHLIFLPDNTVKEEGLVSNVVSMDHIRALVNYQKDLPIKLAPFLSEHDVSPTHFEKMDVGSALRVFSHDTAAAIRYLVQEKDYPKSYLTTAWFVDTVSKWFQIMSSRCRKNALSLARPDIHKQTICFLEKFISLTKEIQIGVKGGWKPSQTGIILATTAVIQIQKELLSQGFCFLLTSRLSQDKLENLFGQVRRRIKTPTAYEFKNALKIITVSQFLEKVRGGNYQSDDGVFVADFFEKSESSDEITDFFKINPSAKRECESVEMDEDFLVQLMEAADPKKKKLLDKDLLYNLCGYVIRSVINRHRIKCDKCLSVLTATQAEVQEHGFGSLVKLRDYTGSSLKYCSLAVFNEIFVPSEELFLQAESSDDYLTRKNGCHQLVHHAIGQITDNLPKCHMIHHKLIKAFLELRTKFAAKERSKNKRAELKAKRKGGERGSRSMTMKKAVTDSK